MAGSTSRMQDCSRAEGRRSLHSLLWLGRDPCTRTWQGSPSLSTPVDACGAWAGFAPHRAPAQRAIRCLDRPRGTRACSALQHHWHLLPDLREGVSRLMDLVTGATATRAPSMLAGQSPQALEPTQRHLGQDLQRCGTLRCANSDAVQLSRAHTYAGHGYDVRDVAVSTDNSKCGSCSVPAAHQQAAPA